MPLPENRLEQANCSVPESSMIPFVYRTRPISLSLHDHTLSRCRQYYP